MLFAKGLIRLPAADTRGGHVRELLSQGSVIMTYTMAAVAEFLGWTRKNKGGHTLQPNFASEVAFKALDAIDDGLVKESDLKGLRREPIKHLPAAKQKDHR